jgi:hypothetical protein
MRHFDVGRIHPDSVAYLDLQCGHASAIVVQLELGFDKGSFGLGHSGSDPVTEFVERIAVPRVA